jgi:predicted nuclease of restriction endonuclease-like (RecB) superfamily
VLKEADNEYVLFLSELKNKIISTQQDAVISVNKELLMFYWEIGNLILNKKNEQGWEEDIINTLSNDLKVVFPDMQGLSEKNIRYMCKFAEEYEDKKFIQEVAAQISWSHNLILMDKISDLNKTISYINKIIENGWSKNVLLNNIELEYGIGEAAAAEDNILQNNITENNIINSKNVEIEEIAHDVVEDYTRSDNIDENNINFKDILPVARPELSVQILKDPYILDLLNFSEKLTERDLEKQLIDHITKFFIELDKGFAFVGNKYHLPVAGGDYYIDLLFYNLKLRCYVAVELKIGKFKPEYLGKLGFYLSLIDDSLKRKEDSSAVGVILCKDEDKLIVQYAFKGTTELGEDTEYMLTKNIPEEFKSILPTVKEIGDGIKDKLLKS